MTEKTLYEKLSNILEKIDAEKYSDIASIIECNIEEDGTVYMDAFDFAVELHRFKQRNIICSATCSLGV